MSPEWERRGRQLLERRAGSRSEVVAGAGTRIPDAVRLPVERRLGHDFSRVRVHADAAAARSASLHAAAAYTFGDHIAFARGQYAPATVGGQVLLTHELVHAAQQSSANEGALAAPASRLEAEAVTAARSGARPTLRIHPPTVQTVPATCSLGQPGACASYGAWVSKFSGVPTFTAADTVVPGGTSTGLTVIGERAASHEAKAPEEQKPPPAERPGEVQRAAERFIDHPTDAWVTTHLPTELRSTAYLLPADCADVAVILRHVWLFYQGRTENYKGWIVGTGAGGTETSRRAHIRSLILKQVSSENVTRMVSPYVDERGNPLRSFADLRDRLHPGDLMVWEHHDKPGGKRTGGHTQTIVKVNRDPDSGDILSIDAIQGNEPISEPQAAEIEPRLGPTSGITQKQLREAPGRRIEFDTFGPGMLHDDPTTGVWTWSDTTTTLVVAGPALAAQRPPAVTRVGRRRVRRITDWVGALEGATSSTLRGRFEGAVLEVRSVIEGGTAISQDDLARIGDAAGKALWRQAKRAGGRADETHFMAVQQIRSELDALIDESTAAALPGHSTADTTTALRTIQHSFDIAARGGADIDWSRRTRRGDRVVRILVTGFDPFNVSDPTAPPRPGEWNPSGAAALALDGTTVRTGHVLAAVEGVVLPVSYEQFKAGLVEDIIRPQLGVVDAVLTVSEDSRITPGEAVRLERYAVGTHLVLETGTLEAVSGGGPAIIEAGQVPGVARETAVAPSRGSKGIEAPIVGADVTLRFDDPSIADSALSDLGLPPAHVAQVVISEPAAIARIIASSAGKRSPDGTRITFQAGTRSYTATVVSGPGGFFLSNEVSYRVLRLLADPTTRRGIVSFHTHTAATPVVPPPGIVKPRERKAAVAGAAGSLGVLVATLRRLIAVVATKIAGSSGP